MVIIKLESVGKVYKRYLKNTDRILEWFGSKVKHQENWVLKNISFNIQKGESVGILGVNGAGKSTLLKIMSGTIPPTEGKLFVNGKVAALLELGMGFDMELTGRENMLISGQIRGLSEQELKLKYVEIEQFADIGEYIDMPVRTYSSGMQVRLAFAISTATLPDILIIDEALAVGDAAFQRKCFRKIEDFCNNGGTVIYVSHDVESVKKLCDKAILLQDGKVVSEGEAKKVCDIYEKLLFGTNRDEVVKSNNSLLNRKTTLPMIDTSIKNSATIEYGNGGAEIIGSWTENEDGKEINVIEIGAIFNWCYKVKFHKSINKPIYGFLIKTRDGISVCGSNTDLLNYKTSSVKEGDEVLLKFTLQANLGQDIYFMNAGVSDGDVDETKFLHRKVDVHAIRVLNNSGEIFNGVANLNIKPSESLSTAA